MAQSEADQRWENLPDNILLKLFSLLEDSDIARASSVCTRWRRCFHEPNFWRSQTFDFNTLCVPKKDFQQKLRLHLCLIGPWVEHVTIACPQKRLLVHTHLAECVKVILETLASVNQTIKTFQISQSFLGVNELRMVKHCKEYTCDVINAMVHFIESQTCLHTLVISEALLPTTFGHMVMSSLARSPSVDTLQQLDISYMYAFIWQRTRHEALVRSTLGKCQNLKEITVSFSTLKGIDFMKMCEETKHSLRLLRVKNILRDQNNDINVGHHAYSYFEYQNHDNNVGSNYFGRLGGGEADDDRNVNQGIAAEEDNEGVVLHIRTIPWREVTRCNSELRVALDLTGVTALVFNHLDSAMPVSSVTLRGIESPEYGDSIVDINEILTFLSRCSWDNLESATFIGYVSEDGSYRRRVETREDLVVNFIRQHKKIWSVKFSADLMNDDLLENVKSKLMTRYHDSRDVLRIL